MSRSKARFQFGANEWSLASGHFFSSTEKAVGGASDARVPRRDIDALRCARREDRSRTMSLMEHEYTDDDGGWHQHYFYKLYDLTRATPARPLNLASHRKVRGTEPVAVDE